MQVSIFGSRVFKGQGRFEGDRMGVDESMRGECEQGGIPQPNVSRVLVSRISISMSHELHEYFLFK